MSAQSYHAALLAAGCTVHDCRWFGSYQGEWVADVTTPNGRRGIIADNYGSCSGCDEFEAEVGNDYHGWETGNGHDPATDPVEGCEKCAEYHAKLRAFGAGYLDSVRTIEEIALDFVDRKGDWWSEYDEDFEQAEYLLSKLDPAGDAAVALRGAMEKARKGAK